ncbi:PAS domain-containing protein [Streptomyces spinosirectus]|jgi:two-component system CheB/CheR fusion protein|nr:MULTISPECIES: CheR family methyltransferase [Streptomyces]MBY8345535.1 PAS domain-containing protein [Streptomyces plumbidurans]PTM83294.1 two-component system CheB/CheR fusion protein [Streptomyces sp. VMFN-G11Ma]UIR17635.1 PAS domain-containing protein [Streptomyces spinosirectus]
MVDGQPGVETDEELEELLRFLRDARGFDFTGYKRSSLGRRIRKRMSDAQVSSYTDYRDRLEANADEFDALFNSILINVTSVFRDPEAWTFLQREVLPELLARSGSEEEIRVWSAGCSSGEEAYSLAIMFAEALGIDEALERVKIYGTDIDDEALRDSRTGLYPAKVLEPLAPELREKYFEPNGARFAFRSDLRRRVIFGRHDITRDAPISRLDLLVCRNTLMYFNVEAQTQIVDRFHFALREGGFLFLGKAEMLLNDAERFDVMSMRQRVFRRRPGEAAPPYQPVPVRARAAGPAGDLHSAARHRRMRDLILDAAPTAALAVDSDGLVVFINSHARAEFGLTPNDIGRPFQDLEISYRPVELRSLIEQATHERRTLRVNGAERRIAEGPQYLDILIQPLTGTDGMVSATHITFTDVTVTTQLKSEIKRVREDLETAYEELQSTNEELETTNEELQSTIEELETTNEELQSTNEELETTNEELQSGTEELETMNEEMRVRNEELDEARTFLETVLTSIAAGVVVLDQDMKVKSWNRGAVDLWGLRPDEVIGQAFHGLDFGLPTEKLRETIQLCVDTGRRGEAVPVASINRLGRPIVCRVQCSPFDGHHGGVVLLMEEGRANGSE